MYRSILIVNDSLIYFIFRQDPHFQARLRKNSGPKQNPVGNGGEAADGGPEGCVREAGSFFSTALQFLIPVLEPSPVGNGSSRFSSDVQMRAESSDLHQNP